MNCQQCGAAQPEGSRFCNGCGATLTSGGDAFAKQDPLIGRVLDERYRLTAVIGSGGMATVYRATRLQIGDEVAVKVLHSEQVKDPQGAERFRREAQAAARLKHPNAVSCYDFGTTPDGLVYLVMELVEGMTLKRLIRERGPMAPSAAAAIVTQACAALDEAHRQGIVHRDMKPDNILLQEDSDGPRVKVLDFGIARLRDAAGLASLTQTGVVMGTPHYMSPEQCLGEELDGRSDVYSMGVVLYEMLAGVVPFNSPTSSAVIVQHVNSAPPPLRVLNASVPANVEAVVMRALEKRREARQETAGELARELAGSVGGVAKGFASPLSTVSAAAGGQAPTLQMRAPLNARQPHDEAVPDPVKTSQRHVVLACLVAIVGLASLVVVALVNRSVGPAHDHEGELAMDRSIQSTLTPRVGSVRALAGHRGLGKNAQGSDVYERTKDGARVILVPGGVFRMGSEKFDDEKPVYEVELSPYLLDEREVTWGQYRRVKGGTPARPDWNPADDHPVVNVTWDEAGSYCEAVGGRLPTEAEWEFAARGKEGRTYPWGEEARGREQAVWSRSPEAGTEAVGSRPAGAGPYGHLDLAGNAFEWVRDWFGDYPSGRVMDPKGPATGQWRVLRGGSFGLGDPLARRGAFRHRSHPSDGDDAGGFRCAQDVP